MARLLRSAQSTGIIAGLTIAVLIAAGLMLAVTHANSAARQQRLVVANYETMTLIRDVVIAIQDAEIGQRGYLLSGDAARLQPYERARVRLESGLQQLEASVANDVDATRQFRDFRTIVAAKLAQLNETIRIYQINGRDDALAFERAGSGRAIMDQMRTLADSFIEGQRLLLARQLNVLRSEQAQADIAGLLVMAGAFVCLVAGIYIVVRGATKLERAQGDLAARSRLLQATLESLQDPIFVVDDKGRVVAWNQAFAKLADWDPGRQAPPTLDHLQSERSPATHALLRPLDLAGPPEKRPAVVRATYDGREYEVYSGEMSGGGAVVRCVDVTEKLRDEAALRQGQKMEATGQLTGGMAHDFNNILQVIHANLDLLKNEIGENEAAMSRVQSAAAATERGARLTQQLLAFARRQPLAPRPTDVARLVSDLSDLLRHSLGERIAVDVRLPPDPWNARIDPGQLENAILNLAINARDAMPDGGSVRIEVSNAALDRRYAALHPEVVPGQYVLVDVSDTGTGMPPEVAAQAFDPFFTTKRDGKGTGLGLSMVYGFVRQSNGHIRIDSAIGQGTSVKMYLPRTPDAVTSDARADAATIASTGQERILVVEDSDDVRRAVVDMLSGWGYRVEAAENPDAASILLAADSDFDLLFTDIVMPGTMTAVELARHAQELRPDMAVLLTSGFARDLVPDQDGAGYPMISKPYSGDALAARVRAVLASRRSVSPSTPSTSRDKPAHAAPAVDRPRRVLLVEDEVVLRMSTTDMLEQLGCLVTGVGSGELALELLEKGEPFDLLVTDLGLPGMGGDQLAAKVRHSHPALPVVIASGYGQSGSSLEGMQFIAKPYSSIDLQQALERASRGDR